MPQLEHLAKYLFAHSKQFMARCFFQFSYPCFIIRIVIMMYFPPFIGF